MGTQTDPTGPSRRRFHAALLEYSNSPGKYSVALRQPPLLFASVREILQLAAGREAEGEAGLANQGRLRDAARFFTRTALFYPGADHYALLGLGRKVDGTELKDRYRLLMRLIHPDLSGTGASFWPADAAVRVNMAYEVLSSAVRRREYDARVAAASEIPSPGKVEHRRSNPPPRVAGSGMSRSGLKKLAVVCSVAGGFLVLIGLLMGGGDSVHLVQRGTQTVAPVVTEVQKPVLPTTFSPTPTAAATDVRKALPQQLPGPPEAKLARAEAVPVPLVMPATQGRTALRTFEAAAAPSVPAPHTPTEPAASVSSPPPAPEVQTPPAALAIAVPAPAPPQPAPAALPAPPPAPAAAVSLAEAQPLLSMLLQHLESGQGERLINMLDRAARNKPSALALSRHYDGLVDGVKPVRLSHVEFKAEPADGRLVVIGNIRLQVGEQTIGSRGKKMVFRAEFASRDGAVVMTGLSSIPGN